MSIFISYRRSTSKHLAQLIFRELRQRGHDAFLDVSSIDSGAFDRIILNQIAARPHFLLILSRGSLERCVNEDDWLRREIEEAFRLKRNIVPIFDEGFNIEHERRYLPEPIRTELSLLNAPPYSHYYFDSFIDTICKRFLKQPVYNVIITPPPATDQPEIQRRITEAIATVQPTSQLPVSDNKPNLKIQSRKKQKVSGYKPNFKIPLITKEKMIVIFTIVLIYIILTVFIVTLQGIKPSNSSPTSALTLLAIQSAYTPVAHNADWTPIEQDFDGITMVLVPAGCFMMGTEDNIDTKPVHQQCFDQPFWLDKYEVTNGQFTQFDGEASRESNWTDTNRPREQITWVEARDFCAKRGARLPTEREWEYAARGPDNLVYPWGNDWNPDNVVWSGNSNSQTAEVGSKTGGMAWVGALDLSGNVWEWVSSLFQPYPYQSDDGRETLDGTDVLVSRGGSWFDINSGPFRASYRSGDSPDIRDFSFGFRCARSIE